MRPLGIPLHCLLPGSIVGPCCTAAIHATALSDGICPAWIFRAPHFPFHISAQNLPSAGGAHSSCLQNMLDDLLGEVSDPW